MAEREKTLVVIMGATATGKTAVSIELARRFRSEVISFDSRQFYREIPIGTAAPTSEEQRGVPHHFIGSRSLTEEYSAGKYAADALRLIEERFEEHPMLFMVGGSGLYADAVCYGMDEMPEVDPALRAGLDARLREEGLESLVEQLGRLDPLYYAQVDRSNPQRVVRALEVCLQTGAPYSSLRRGSRAGFGEREEVSSSESHVAGSSAGIAGEEGAVRSGAEAALRGAGENAGREFRIVKVGLRMPREVLYERINRRVDIMLGQGLEQEARAVYHLRELNALQTVGYRELFSYFDGEISHEEAVELIKRNSRRYAKRQETWFGRDETIEWFEAGAGGGGVVERIADLLDEFVK